jgi:hypothetical protein
MITPKPSSWSNWLEDRVVNAMRLAPRSKAELIEAVEWAVCSNSRLRAVGSGHSHSKVALPRDAFVDLANISGVFDEAKWLKDSLPGVATDEHVARVRAGTTIKVLNRRELAQRGLALMNMGAFDAQTVAGAINTATHGTGITLGSLADAVLSVDIVTVTRNSDGTPHVQMRRIEPTDGITDRAAFNRDKAEHGMVLEQDDDTFHSVVVGYGCMGIAFAYTLKVQRAYWLHERRELVEWPELREQLAGERIALPGVGLVPRAITRDRHYWFLLNIAEMQGKNATKRPACLVWRRNDAPIQQRDRHGPDPWPPERHPTPFQNFGKWIADDPQPQKSHDGLGRTLRNRYFENEAGWAPFTDNRASTASYIAHRRTRDLSPVDEPPEPEGQALSVEIGIEADRAAEAIDAMIEEVKRSRYFFAVPIGVRFGPPSRHFLSPAYGRPTAYIELPMILAKAELDGEKLDRTQMLDRIAEPELARIERALRPRFAARPHLGKHHGLDGELLFKAYPRINDWLEVYRRFNAFGTFDNPFTDDMDFRGG